MKKMVMLLSLFFTSCAAQKCPENFSRDLSEMKYELIQEQKKLQTQKEYVQKLQEEIARNEIALIQKEIDQVDQHSIGKLSLSYEHWLSFFFQQREILHQIIRNTPTCRMEAEEVLDKILTLITQLSDQAYE